ncbi:MAG: hypothetical protein F6K56_10040 [Moorea sp. SIO3G5]|nr:hypothetical protein [Moorena sp. SIO3G5]
MLDKVKQIGKAVSRLYLIWVDGGNSCESFIMWVMDLCGWMVQFLLRPQQTKGFVLLKKRWVVERTFGWLIGCCRYGQRLMSYWLKHQRHSFIWL